MATPIGSITRAATRKTGDSLNILTFPTHERYQSGLANVNATFYLVRAQGIKDWNRGYAALPQNHVLLNPARGERQIPVEVDFDLVWSQNKFGQFQLATQIADALQLPLVSLEHTLPVQSWPKSQLDTLKTMRGHVNVFISDFSRKTWGWGEDEARVIHHGVDTQRFSPNDMVVDKKPHVLSVVNDWMNRDWCCGFRLWQETTKGMPVFVVGDTPGLSKPAASLAELVMRYREAQVFLNTSLVSPVPTVLLEAMSCGCAVVSTANCMIPEVIEHGVNGFLANDPAELRRYCDQLLKDESLRQAFGKAARATIVNRFGLDAFQDKWEAVFTEAAKQSYV
jgi:glycosyltransferase involved in cell wall biosynthesis